MLFRVIISLLCVALFIGGCSSLTSQFFGTHKLRTFTMTQLEAEGLGDADYVEISGVHLVDDIIEVPKSREWGRGLLMFPGLSAPAREDAGTVLVLWTERHDPACVTAGTCFTSGEQTIRGLVRRPSRLKNRVETLKTKGYAIATDPIYLEVNRAPRAWYWNLLMMAGAFGLVFMLEQRYSQRGRKP